MDKLKFHYPELFSGDEPLVSNDDLANITESHQRLLPNIEQETKEHTIIQEFGDRAIRSMLWKPESATDTIVIPRYFGGGIGEDATWLAETIKATANPDTAVLILPNSKQGEDNLQLNERDRELLASGNVTPYSNRLEAILEEQGLDETNLHFVGASQGSIVSLAVAEKLGRRVDSLTLIDMPELTGHSSARNALRLIRSMRNYEENQRIGSPYLIAPHDEGLKQGKNKSSSSIENKDLMAMNAFMNIRDNNVAISSIARHNHHVAITLARGAESHLSSDEGMDRLANLAGPRTTSVRFDGEFADHSVAMMPVPIAALARHSINMSDAIGSDSLVA
jgi:pimeloyl-ACP methyl ester carboxylesterase